MTDATLTDDNGRPVLRFERYLAHPPEKVWRAVTEPDEFARWFPAAVTIAGEKISFAFGDEPGGDGVVLAMDPPRLFAYRWGDDELRWEIVPDGAGSRLVFTHILSGEGPMHDRISAARHAAGWDLCLDALLSHHADPGYTWLDRAEHYVEVFGLATGTVEGGAVRFARDLVQPATDVWAFLVESAEPAVGDEPPLRCTNPVVPATPLTAVKPDRLLAYGNTRFDLVPGPWGCVLRLSHEDPTAEQCAAWQVHLELLFAGLNGDLRPWPQDRVEELAKTY